MGELEVFLAKHGGQISAVEPLQVQDTSGSHLDDKSNVIVPTDDDVLDTAQVSGKVLLLLQLYRIPIAQFGLHVLERSPSRTSELLNKPKSFENLSQDGREIYRKMKRWLEQKGPIAGLKRKMQGSQIDHQQSNEIAPAAADVLDTAQVSGKVLHLLQLYKIPISQFGLHVLERSQGRTSELLNKPKPFEKLSRDGREVYRKMKRWLEQEDPIGYVKRKIVQGKRKRGQSTSTVVVRTKFSVLQRMALETLYKDTKYPAHGIIEEFANSHNLDSRTVRIWFNNKRQRGENSGNAAASVESEDCVAESKELTKFL